MCFVKKKISIGLPTWFCDDVDILSILSSLLSLSAFSSSHFSFSKELTSSGPYGGPGFFRMPPFSAIRN